jgi:RNA polymerase sigma-70 factor (ECF subfamily)
VSGIRREARRPTSPLDDDIGHVFGSFDSVIVLHELDRALERLPKNQKAALLLASLEDMSYEEISSVIGVPVGTVRSRISRARDRLRKHFGEENHASAPLARDRGAHAPVPAEPEDAVAQL